MNLPGNGYGGATETAATAGTCSLCGSTKHVVPCVYVDRRGRHCLRTVCSKHRADIAGEPLCPEHHLLLTALELTPHDNSALPDIDNPIPVLVAGVVTLLDQRMLSAIQAALPKDNTEGLGREKLHRRRVGGGGARWCGGWKIYDHTGVTIRLSVECEENAIPRLYGTIGSTTVVEGACPLDSQGRPVDTPAGRLVVAALADRLITAAQRVLSGGTIPELVKLELSEVSGGGSDPMGAVPQPGYPPPMAPAAMAAPPAYAPQTSAPAFAAPPPPAPTPHQPPPLQRVDDLHYDSTPVDGEEQLSALGRLGAFVLGATFGSVALSDRARAWCHPPGTLLRPLQPRPEQALVAVVTGLNRPLIISDAGADPEFAQMLATAGVRLAMYAGVPLRSREGVAVGALCVADAAPRMPGRSHLEVLASLGHQAEALLEANRALHDHTATAASARHSASLAARQFDAAPIGMMVIDLAGRYVQVNAAFADMLGISREQIVGHPVTDITAQEDQMRDARLVAEVAQGHRESVRMMKRYRRVDGSVLSAALSMTLVRDEAGAPNHIYAQAVDPKTAQGPPL